jgi:hypothetical protein
MNKMYDLAVFQPHKMLQNLLAWLDEAVELAKSKSMDPETLLASTLSPDQFNLRKQIQTVCDTAKLTPSRLTGIDAPKHEDGDQSLEQLRGRIKEVIDYLDTFQASQFENTETAVVALPFLEGMGVDGFDYILEFGGPNLYFHLSMVYAILRHNGVGLGKRAYIGTMRVKPLEEK